LYLAANLCPAAIHQALLPGYLSTLDFNATALHSFWQLPLLPVTSSFTNFNFAKSFFYSTIQAFSFRLPQHLACTIRYAASLLSQQILSLNYLSLPYTFLKYYQSSSMFLVR
jgi:hypothetical protein